MTKAGMRSSHVKEINMKKLLSLLLILVLLPLSALAEDPGKKDVHAFDFELTGDLLWENFPEGVREQIKGYADLLAITKISGTAAFAEDGNHSFDVDLKITVKDTKEAVVPIHFFGYDDLIFFDSPLINNEIFYVDLPGLMIVATKVADYFDFPFSDILLAVPGSWEIGTRKLTEYTATMMNSADSEGNISEEALQIWAEGLKNLIRTDTGFEYWLKAIGLQSGLNSEVAEELENLPSFVRDIALGQGGSLICSENTKVFSIGETQIYEEKGGGEEKSLQFDIPLLPITGYKANFSLNESTKDISTDWKLNLRVAPEHGNQILDLKMAATDFPNKLLFDKEFAVSIGIQGILKGNGNTMITGTRRDDLYCVRVDHRFENEEYLNSVFELRASIIPRSDRPRPDYGRDLFDRSYYVLSQNETTLAELEGRIAGPMIKGILPVLVQAPASFCKSIMDFVCDHNIIAFVTGHFNAEDMD